MAYIHCYQGTNKLSEGDGTYPLVVGPLNASNNEESAPIALTFKCDSGYKTYGNSTVSFTGTNANKWSVCATSDGTYAATLAITSVVDATNGVTVYVKAKATSDEAPSNDTSVKIQLASVIQAA